MDSLWNVLWIRFLVSALAPMAQVRRLEMARLRSGLLRRPGPGSGRMSRR